MTHKGIESTNVKHAGIVDAWDMMRIITIGDARQVKFARNLQEGQESHAKR